MLHWIVCGYVYVWYICEIHNSWIFPFIRRKMNYFNELFSKLGNFHIKKHKCILKWNEWAKCVRDKKNKFSILVVEMLLLIKRKLVKRRPTDLLQFHLKSWNFRIFIMVVTPIVNFQWDHIRILVMVNSLHFFFFFFISNSFCNKHLFVYNRMSISMK